MRVAVVGAGGVGSVFGGRLAAAGHEVWLIHRRREVVAALRRDGLHLESLNGDVERIPLLATDSTAEVGEVDLILILTKSIDTRAAAEAARSMLGDATTAVTLQNGLGNLEIMADALGSERVLLGMTYAGAVLVGPGHVRHTAIGKSFLGEPSGQHSDRAAYLARTLSEAGMPTEATDRLWEMVWGKLVINAAMNATCGLTGASGEAALRSEAACTLVGLVAEETAAVAAALGISLPYPDAAARVRQHCRDVGPSKPSMLQDMERGRPTEIDAINGAIVREGVRLGVPTPLNQALLLLVKARIEVQAQS
ncbi:MAG TPA: 2-dehydropantoate 2-reductase [Chloroflexota bacterium]|nr:2-dehydropantoate 2-reductase [Chloroflexota bacterium]